MAKTSVPRCSVDGGSIALARRRQRVSFGTKRTGQKTTDCMRCGWVVSALTAEPSVRLRFLPGALEIELVKGKVYAKER